MQDFNQFLGRIAKESGAASVCCLDLNSPELQQALRDNKNAVASWLDEGYGADMDYLVRMLDDKVNLQKTFPGAQSAIVITFTNKWGADDAVHPFPEPAEPSIATVKVIKNYSNLMT